MWSSIDRFTTQGIQFVFSILIARLLLPSDYGVVAMLGIFLAVSQTFVDSGFGMALIRKIDRTDTDFSTVFYFNIAVGLFFYAVLWLASPYIAAFYDIPLLEDVTKVVALTLVFSSFSGDFVCCHHGIMGDFMFCRRLAKGRGRSSSLARPRHERAEVGASAQLSLRAPAADRNECGTQFLFCMVRLFAAPRSFLTFERIAALPRNVVAFDAVHFHGGKVGAPLRRVV